MHTYLIGTIEDNLRMGKFDANEREINEALKKANLYDFVQSLPEKLQTMLEKVERFYQVVKSKD